MSMDPPLFSTADLFGHGDDHSDGEVEPAGPEDEPEFVERSHQFPGMVLSIREFSFHQFNANLLWPGTFIFAEWLLAHKKLIQNRHTLEIGSGTGALAIFIKKSLDQYITTSDYDDEAIERNISNNCVLNGLQPLRHIRHTWGEEFPLKYPDWDLIVASDILLYVKQYANLIKTIVWLLQNYTPRNNVSSKTVKISNPSEKQDEYINYQGSDGSQLADLPVPCFLMSWRRRIPKEDESVFFDGCKNAGLIVQHIESKVYCISLR